MEDQSLSHGGAELRMSQLDGAETRSLSSEGIVDGEFEMKNSLEVGAEATVGGDFAVEVKRKRGRPRRGQEIAPHVKKQKEDEDVCFICFDGGSLVLCDRQSCPKAYHPACIKRDDSFFRSNIKWNCGWHICSVCQKAAHYMCYTCTYSLCKGCTKDADYLCVRGDKGFCSTCLRTIMLIEKREEGNKDMAGVDFDDKSTWEYLFKVYWLYLKEKFSLNLADLSQTKNPWKEPGAVICKRQVPVVHGGVNNIKSSNLHRSCGQLALNSSMGKKPNKSLNLHKDDTKSTDKAFNDNVKSLTGSTYWATKELLDFVAHMKNGDTSVLSQFDVQELLLDYIKRNNLRDPRLRSHILCDSRLRTLFGKSRVGHFEMLKLIEFHFFVKEEAPKDVFIQGGVVDTNAVEELAKENIDILSVDKKRKTRKKVEERAPQTNLVEYAAIDVHNINMIYLRRSLMEDLIEDKEKFHNKVVGSVVRIRISGGEQKNNLYRLVQVVGTMKVPVPYKTSSKTADVMLEVLNLDKKEVVSIDAISNQDFSEDECRRLRQSIKCGIVNRFSVGEIHEKALEIQSMRFNDWVETETLRLTHLRDRASENGRYKELRECVEKLELLKTTEEYQRRLREICNVHIDPNMHPDYESEEEAEPVDSQKQVQYMKPRYSGKREDKPISPSKEGDIASCPNKEETAAEALQRLKEGRDACRLNSWEKSRTEVSNLVQGIGGLNNQTTGTSITFSTIGSKSSTLPFSVGEAPSAYSTETKVWHYIDPNGKTQGPFCMSQLQKWSTTGYFPPDMKIWAGDGQDNSILLTDALKGLFHKFAPLLNGKQQQVQSPPLSATVVGRENGTDVGDEIYHKIIGCKSDPNYEIRSQSGTTVGKSPVGHILDDHFNTQFLSGQSYGNNLNNSPAEFSLNALQLSSVPSLTSLTVAPEQNGKLNVTSLQSPSQHNGEIIKIKESVLSSVYYKDSFFPELPSPTPKTGIDCQNELNDRTRISLSVNLPCQDIGLKWSNTSSIVVGKPQLADISGDWGGYSPTPAEHYVNEWHSGLISLPSLKPAEGLRDHFGTAASTSGELAHSSASHLSSWQTAICEPIEFSTLAEESVSDLLAEVDAMESRRGLASPTSAVNCGKDRTSRFH